MQTLIIGANGNLGKAVTKQLSAKKQIKAATRSQDVHRNIPNVENVVFDFEKPETYKNAIENVDSVFIQAPPLDAQAYQKLSPFIEYLGENGIKRVVFNSAWGVDHNEDAPLRKIERKLMNEGFDYTFTRPNFFLENFTSGFAAAPLNNDKVIVHNAGEAKLAFVSVEDIASVVVESFIDENHIGKGYNLSGKEAISHQDVANFFTQKMGENIQNVSLSADQMKAGAMESGLPESEADYLVMLYNIAAEGHMAHLSNDIYSVLGREPKSINEI